MGSFQVEVVYSTNVVADISVARIHYMAVHFILPIVNYCMNTTKPKNLEATFATLDECTAMIQMSM